MSPYYVAMINSPGLCHYGVKGTHWGVRNYQYEDGSYKPGAEGRYAPKGRSSGGRRGRPGGRSSGGGIYGVNERYYSKRADKLSSKAKRNSTMASMNRAAKNKAKSRLGKKIYEINENYYTKRAKRLMDRAGRNSTMASMNRAAIESRNSVGGKRIKTKSSKKKAAKKSSSGGIYGVNERYYSNRADKFAKKANKNRTMASMNRSAKNSSKTALGRKIYEINENYYSRREQKLNNRANRNRAMASMNRAARKN